MLFVFEEEKISGIYCEFIIHKMLWQYCICT